MNRLRKKFFAKILSLHVFDEPRPRYVSKITITDKILNRTILFLFPKYVRPNFITVFRFVTIPFIVLFLLEANYLWGFWLFIISACSDAIDGAIARTRHQITDWGIVFDPLADKLLIGSVGVIVISKLINPLLTTIIIVLEILLLTFSYFRFKGRLVPAQTVGKIKMILQSIGVGLLIFSFVSSSPILIPAATYTLYLSIVFSLLSLFVYRSV